MAAQTSSQISRPARADNCNAIEATFFHQFNSDALGRGSVATSAAPGGLAAEDRRRENGGRAGAR
jgi:hypothetical protein